MRITGSYVGIGTTSPSTKLHIAAGTDAAVIRLQNTVSSLSLGDTIGAIQFYNSDTTDDSPNIAASIYATAGPSGGSGYLSFRTTEAGTEGAAATATMTLSNGGRVGINTTTPSSKLHVKGTWITNEGILVIDADSGTRYSGLTMQNNGTAYGYLYHDNTDSYVDLYASSTTGLRFSTADTARMVITSGGNVGIGTTSPGAKLHVQGIIDWSSGIRAQGNTANGVGLGLLNDAGKNWFFISTGASNGGGANNLGIYEQAGDYRMYIKSGGNVGIGTTSPAAKLHVDGDAIITGIITAQEFHTEFVSASIIYQSGSTKFGDTADDTHSFTGSLNITGSVLLDDTSRIKLGDDQDLQIYHSGNHGFINGSSGAGSLYLRPGAGGTIQLETQASADMATFSSTSIRLHIGGAEKMIVNSAGNVGIGTTSPAALLTVSNTVDNGAAVRVQRTNALSGSYTELGTVGGSGRIESFNGNLTIGADASNTDSSSVIQFKVDNSEKVRINSSGNVGIGTTSPVAPIDVSSASNGNRIILRSTVTPASTPSMTIGTQYYYTGTTFTGGSQIVFEKDNATAGNYGHHLQFWTRENGSSVAEKMRITSDGNVGIGTTAPGSILDIRDNGEDGEASIRIANTFQSSSAVGESTSLFFGFGNPTQDLVRAGRIIVEKVDDYSTTATRKTKMTFTTRNGDNYNGFILDEDGQLQLSQYGSGTFTGTATKTLAVTSNGTVIELDVSSNGTGVANEVAFWKDTDTVSGSQDFTWDGTTLSINGVLEANEKSFVIEHPTQPGKKLVYGVLEGPEHAVYCRGKISGEVIELPEEWTGLVHEDSITVQLTSIGKHQNLYVVDIRDNKVFIKNGDLLTSKINAYYYIQATRKDTKPLQTVRDK